MKVTTGSLIHGTHRPQDLVPVFLDAITYFNKKIGDSYRSSVPPEAFENDNHEFWDSWECQDLLNESLFDALNDFAPEGYYFGAHEGNGSDFGFWECPEDF